MADGASEQPRTLSVRCVTWNVGELDGDFYHTHMLIPLLLGDRREVGAAAVARRERVGADLAAVPALLDAVVELRLGPGVRRDELINSALEGGLGRAAAGLPHAFQGLLDARERTAAARAPRLDALGQLHQMRRDVEKVECPRRAPMEGVAMLAVPNAGRQLNLHARRRRWV